MMAWAFTVAILFSVAAAAAASLSIPLHPDSGTFGSTVGSNGTTMFLPLFFNNHNHHSHKDGFYPRRHLQNRSTPNARMPLHDDLLLNGYYTTRLWIGTPPQGFALIVDTGSTVTYVPCSTCEQCGKHQDPKFQPELSTTYQPVKCNIECACDNNREQCIYERQYAEMSSSSGVLGEDIVSFGNQSDLKPQRAVFGCETMETGDLYSQHADGIMGLGRGDLSIVDQLVNKGVISDSFSLCYGGMDVGGGAMVLGGISPPADMVFARSDPVRSPYYNIELRELHVAGKKLALDPKVFDGKHGTVLDSGTTYAYLPELAFGAFKEAVFKELQSLKRIQGPDPNYNDICFSGAGSSQLSQAFPSVEMVFNDGQKLLLSPENYLFRHSKVRGAYCLGIFQNGKDPTTLLGGIIVRNTLVTYDREHEKIGFWKTNCSELWERLHLPTASPPLPSGTGQMNSTMNRAPTLAPTLPPTLAPIQPLPPKAPGKIKIGLITFYMLLTVKYPELKPHISELTQFIAKELDVNASQVQLVNFTPRENDTLIKWAIFPAESAGYISNATALNIISRLSENGIHLPDSYGTYKVFEWKIEPPSERSWWQQHYLVIVIPFIIIMVAAVLAFGAWFIWHRQQAVLSYKPVDSVVAEQELQPLQN
ncbi:aspartic proteinase-like protein 2 isoform X2 [Sesamum indicum]|uniref:Aspartic proteinase-like protein 2 isoform X2 n=1 Tax=Sesamum indicum TaxID=4182 RepID=A0A6I9UCN5_SESIN|nr:aspartic proteinase-like protein 2 isoform X2 [Sesamum indicum]